MAWPRSESIGREVLWLTRSLEDVPSQDDWLSPAERERASSFRFPKRNADWRLGRWTAKTAFRLARGIDSTPSALARVEILAAPSGVPEIWADGLRQAWSLSISHSQKLGMAALAPAGTALGCDVETIETRSGGFLEDYFTPEERRIVEGEGLAERDLRMTLIWSAKESALKALGEGFRRSLQTVCVRLEPQQENAWQPLLVAVTDERPLHGGWRREGRHVLTLVANPAPDTVRRLED